MHHVPDVYAYLDLPCSYFDLTPSNIHIVLSKMSLTNDNHSFSYETNILVMVHTFVYLIQIRDRAPISVIAHY